MEHLPLPHDAIIPERDQVFLLSQSSYDNGLFLTYPLRCTPPRPHLIDDTLLWDVESLTPTPTEELEALCQEWLFFGLLNEILGPIFTRSNYIEQEGRITTRTFVSDMQKWIVAIRASNADAAHQYKRYRYYARCLWTVHSVLMFAQSRRLSPGTRPFFGALRRQPGLTPSS